MRNFPGLILLVCVSCLYAQTEESPEVVRAKAGIEKLRALVEAGVVPKAQLDKAESGIADAEDAALLRKTLYGADLTDDQAGEMLAAAQRRVDRRRQSYEEGKKLVDNGVASLLSLSTFLEELDLARKELDLAESRARLTHELTQMARAEEQLDGKLDRQLEEDRKPSDRYESDGAFNMVT